MNIEKNKNSTYIIRLINNNAMTGTYKVNEKIFYEIEKQIKQYRSFRHKPKKVKCIETGEIFERAKDANEMLIKRGISNSYTAYSAIKEVCNKKKDMAYGFHWEFVEE